MSKGQSRRERYVRRQAKARAKEIRLHKRRPRGAHLALPHKHRKHGPNVAAVWPDPYEVTYYPTMSQRSYHPSPLAPVTINHYYLIAPAGYKTPPIVVGILFGLPTKDLPSHYRGIQYGYARRQAYNPGRKPYKLSGVDRQRAWARMFFCFAGLYPLWDPDHRSPHA